ncbi:L-amino acid transmembrane transporter [Malassezia pachydermatis]
MTPESPRVQPRSSRTEDATFASSSRMDEDNEDFEFDYTDAILQLAPTHDDGEGIEEQRHHRSTSSHARLTLFDAISLTIGLQVGSGIFSSPGVITAYTGSIGASLLIWVISGILALTGASSYAELASAIPLNGGPQAYLQYAFGPLMSYLYSFTAIIAMKASSAAIISTIFGEYTTRVILHLIGGQGREFHKLLPKDLPMFLVKALASSAIFVVFLVHAFHPMVGPRVQLSVTITKILLLGSIPTIAIVLAHQGKIPEASSQAFSSIPSLFSGSTSDISRYALALYSGLWAYDGWDQSTFVAGEMVNPSRDISRAISFSTLTVMALFLTTVISYFVVLPPDVVVRTNSVALDFGSSAFGSIGGILFAALVAFSCLGALNGHLYTYSRLTAAAGRDGFLPHAIGTMNTRFHTPLNALILTCCLATAFVVFGSGFASLVNFSGVCAWFWYGTTVTGLLVLRVNEPHLERPFRVWIVIPIVFVMIALFLLIMPVFSAPWEALAAFGFIAVGVLLYFLTQSEGRQAFLARFSQSQYSFEPIPTENDQPLHLQSDTPAAQDRN